MLRPFVEHERGLDPRNELPASSIFGKAHQRRTPHIYTDQEIVALLKAARRLQPQHSIRPATYETMLGLIAATGLRISEALKLRCGDVDIAGRCLTVRMMKRADRPLIGFLTRAKIQAVLNAPDDATWAGRRDRVLFSLMYNTGARVTEIIGIRCCDVVLEGQPAVHLHGKGRKQRCVPLWRPTAALVRRWQRSLGATAQDGFLLPNRAGARMTRANVTQRLDLAVAAARRHLPSLADRSISPHVLRHTTAMHLLQSGVDITVIALWLGHEDTATTHMYVEAADLSMKEQALGKLQPHEARLGRYRPPDHLMRLLEGL